jgi:hypothetical protein
MIKGTYIFKQGGVEIGRSDNIITTHGKEAIVQYLADSTFEWASAIAVGSINTTPALSDLTLKYETARTGVTLKSYKNGSPSLIIVKGTLDANLSANIYEIGVFPSKTKQVFGTRDQLIIDDFSTIVNWSTSSGTAYTTNAYAAQSPYSPRIGLYSVAMAAGSTIVNSNFNVDLSTYSPIDTLDLLVNVDSGKSGTLNVTLTDVNGLTSTLAYTFGTTTGYQILSQALPSSIFSLSNVKSIQFATVGANSDITLDAIKVAVLSEISDTTSLVSRSVLTTPIAKIYGTPLDIEYYVQLS